MTLTEYLKQTNPKRMPIVYLQPGEYTIEGAVKVGLDTLTGVYLPAFNYSYVHISGKRRLYTMDEHGNPKRPSCFYIEDL